jgi:hypothetical protein
MIGPAPFLVYLFPIAFLALIVLVVASVFRSRGEGDEHGRRPFAVYLLAVMFISLFAAVASVQQLTSVLIDEALGTRDFPGSFGFAGSVASSVAVSSSEGVASIPHEDVSIPGRTVTYTDLYPSTFPDVLQALIAGALAGSVFAFHARKLRDLVRKEEAGD